ncbi:hypothetical protein HOM13_02450 [Candidatus Woesearchaeota archaeon]|jgi:hypothetical protein|nr:hypothetical protein [Candidatus Woesearchaeota archaeon]MBT5215574.1 hypothetical protein [Candidatus Woesearchaeota archaeon]MBT6402514.1 hypothetical protein [Candidatus Woesearchaeota archaeon]
MTDYNSNKQTNYTESNEDSSLYVLQGRIKKKGICTCEKKMPCRGTCIPR